MIHQKTRLISVTTPTLAELETAEELIAYCARVSNPTNQLNNETADKLLAYCAKHSHWSIFEMLDVTIEIQTSRDIGRQILRHKSASFQEFSQRYAEVSDDMFCEREARLQDQSNRQNSIVNTDVDIDLWFLSAQQHLLEVAKNYYSRSLELGIAKEQARCFLPEGLTMSRMYMKNNLRNWIHYINLRTGPETQKEHRLIALQIKDIIVELFPSIKDILK